MTEAEKSKRFARKLRRWAREAEKRHEHTKAAELRALAEKNDRASLQLDSGGKT